jgi:predicted permease
MLVTGAGLLGRSMLQLLSVDPGFDPRNVLTMEVQATGPRYVDARALFAHQDRIVEAVKRVPGVVDAGFANQLPLAGNKDTYGVNAEDRVIDNPELAPSADRYTASAGFLSTLRLRLIRGRMLTDQDNRDSTQKVVVISASLADRIWGTNDVLGKRIRMGGDSPYREVVGVVADVRHDGLQEEHPMQTYVPPRQWFFADDILSLVVRTKGDPRATSAAIADAVRALDKSQPVMRIMPMEDVVSQSVGQRRLALTLFAVFGAFALILAGAGVYGVLAGTITERTREIGIRTALGASTSHVVTLVTRQAMLLVVTGAVGGLLGAMAIGRYLEAMLYAVEPIDFTTLAFAGVIACVTGLVACLMPTLRALRIQPTEALRAS